ncbi:MAG TPA: GAF domain-containing protein [Lentimicrobium sp.]|jgi:GAF domain-containing protein|nr:GAF domain-containing protein [Lentimicrobium sp.]
MEKQKKEGRYQRLVTQISGLLEKSPDLQSAMATVASVLHNKMDYFFWCGFYRLSGDRLIVGPYQGPPACQVLEGRGVCLEAVRQRKTLVVADVHSFPGHIACDSRSNSEIVVPLFGPGGDVAAVLDVDSRDFNSFDDTDARYLESIVKLLGRFV